MISRSCTSPVCGCYKGNHLAVAALSPIVITASLLSVMTFPTTPPPSLSTPANMVSFPAGGNSLLLLQRLLFAAGAGGHQHLRNRVVDCGQFFAITPICKVSEKEPLASPADSPGFYRSTEDGKCAQQQLLLYSSMIQPAV